jgi:putative tricarboxylic transport membrane protein
MERPENARQINAVWWRTNRGIGALLTLLLVVFFVYLYLSDWTHEELRDGFTLGFFPLAGVLAMLACTLMLVFDSHRHEVEEGLATIGWRGWLLCAALLLGCYAYFALAQVLGYLLTSPFFLFILIYLLGMRPWTTALIASVVMTLVVFGLFTVLGVALPSGVLPF